MTTAHPAKTKDLRSNDTIVVVMGPTGAGKSTFIDVATNHATRSVSHGLASYTSEIRPVRVRHDGDEIVLVDTPGFDDTKKSDAEILEMLAGWLKETYEKNVKVSLIIYMHRITDNRMAGTPYKNLRMFGKLCGENATENVILATTMWENLPQNKRQLGDQREKELMTKYWRGMVAKGSIMRRFYNDFDSAWDILGTRHRRVELLIQDEMVGLKKSLPETEAAITLYNNLQKLLADQQKNLQELRRAAEKEADVKLVEELMKQEEQIKYQLKMTFQQLRGLKVPLGRRILALFGLGNKKSSVQAIEF